MTTTDIYDENVLRRVVIGAITGLADDLPFDLDGYFKAELADVDPAERGMFAVALFGLTANMLAGIMRGLGMAAEQIEAALGQAGDNA